MPELGQFIPLGTGKTTIDVNQTVRTAQIRHTNNEIDANDGEIIGDGTGGDANLTTNFLETNNSSPAPRPFWLTRGLLYIGRGSLSGLPRRVRVQVYRSSWAVPYLYVEVFGTTLRWFGHVKIWGWITAAVAGSMV